MGDKRRFKILSDFIAKNTPASSKIADVAAGKGNLTIALWNNGFKNIHAYEPNPRKHRPAKNLPLFVRNFECDLAKNYDVIAGMHPDEATEEIICGAARHNKKMFLVPCCAKTSKTAYWAGRNDFFAWIDHLLALCRQNHLTVERTRLPMNGRNILLWTP